MNLRRRRSRPADGTYLIMSNPLSIAIQRELIAELHRLAAERDAAEKRVEAEFRARNAAAEKEFAAAKDQLAKQFKTDLDATQKEFDQALGRPKSEYESQHDLFETELTETRERVLDKYNTREQEAIKQLEQDTWQATTVFEASHPGLLEQFNRVEARIFANIESLKIVAAQARQHLEICRQAGAWDAAPIDDLPADAADPFKELSDRAAAANGRLDELRRLITPRFGIGVRRQVLGVLIFIVVMASSLALINWSVWHWLGFGAAFSGMLIALVLMWLYHFGRMQAGAVCGAIRQDIADAEKYKERCHVEAKAYYEAQRAKMAKRHRHEIRKANERHLARMTELTSDRDGAVVEAEDIYNRRELQLIERRDKLLREAQAKYPVLLAEIRTRHERQQFEAKSRYDRLVRESKSRQTTDWNAMAAKWCDGMRQLYDTVAGMNAESERLFPAWDDPAWKEWTPPTAPPPAVRFGDYSLRLDQVPGGISTDPRLKPDGPTVISLPALLPFPHNASISIQAAGEGRLAAVHVLRAVMLRLLGDNPARQAAVHDHRSGRPGREFRRLHAPGRLRRHSGDQPHLDRAAADRGPTRRSDRADGKRDPKISAQRFSNDRRIQRVRGRSGGGVSGVGGGEFSGQFHGDRRPPADEHRRQRCAVRSVRADDDRHEPIAADAVRSEGRRVARDEPDVGRRTFRLERAGSRQVSSRRRFAASRGAIHADRAIGRRECQGLAPRRGAIRVHRPRRRQMVDRQHFARDQRRARPRRRDEAAALATGPRHFAARARRGQDRLRKVDALARTGHESRARPTAPPRSNSI